MKEIKTNGIELLLVEVPGDAKEFDISDMGNLIYYIEWGNSGHIDLPEYGQYQILGKSTELSEEQMKEICEQVIIRNGVSVRASGFLDQQAYPDYRFDDVYQHHFSTVQESYLSLLEANGIDNNKTHLVLKRI